MSTTDQDVDNYLSSSTQWPDEMRALRPVLLDAGLTEALKWRKPCYVHGDRNIAIMQEMKHFLALMFFDGALLDDPDGVLESQGQNTRAARRVCLRSVDDVERLTPAITALVEQAIAAADAGLTVEKSDELVLVDELQTRLDGDPALRTAFEALTPGRQREYHLHVSGAKKPETRESRIDTCAPRILEGRGLRDR